MAERPEEQPKFVNLTDRAEGWKPSAVPAPSVPSFQQPKAYAGMKRPDTLSELKGERPEPPPPAPNKNTPQFRVANTFDPSKKKNVGGLSAARQHVVPDFFPGQLDQLKLGPVRIQPIGFKGASPQINLRTVAFNGFPKGQL